MKKIVETNVRNFQAQGYSSVVVVCNTASIIIERFSLANEFPSFHIITIVKPTLDALTDISYPNIHILASQFTVDSNVYLGAIEDMKITEQITQSPEQLLISYIENREWKQAQHEVVRIIKNIDSTVNMLVLACTHFSIIKQLFEQELITKGKNIRVIDSSEELAKRVESVLKLYPQWH